MHKVDNIIDPVSRLFQDDQIRTTSGNFLEDNEAVTAEELDAGNNHFNCFYKEHLLTRDYNSEKFYIWLILVITHSH